MSADRYSLCPQCIYRAEQAAAAERIAVNSSYGLVPLADFESRLAALHKVEPDMYRTFREGWEFQDVATGTVRVVYGGDCTVCGLTVSIDHSETFWTAP